MRSVYDVCTTLYCTWYRYACFQLEKFRYHIVCLLCLKCLKASTLAYEPSCNKKLGFLFYRLTSSAKHPDQSRRRHLWSSLCLSLGSSVPVLMLSRFFIVDNKIINCTRFLFGFWSPELGTRQLFSFATTTTPQRNRASVTKNMKNVKVSVSKWSGHNESI